MKNKITKLIMALNIFTMVLILTSCGNIELENNSLQSETFDSTTSSEETSKNEEEQTTELEDIIIEHKNTTLNRLSSYGSILEETRFELIYSENNTSESVYEGKSFKGKAQLERDGKELDISVYDDGNMDTYIVIADEKCEFFGTHLENVYVVDVDSTDTYKEVVVLDTGLSDDPTLHMFRYVDGKIYDVGSFEGNDYNEILFDGKGLIIEGNAYIDFVEPHIVTEYNEIVDNKLKNTKVDCTQYLYKKYIISRELMIAFEETDDMTKYPDINTPITLEQGTEITLIKFDPMNKLYYIELLDGRKGTMTTQLAG